LGARGVRFLIPQIPFAAIFEAKEQSGRLALVEVVGDVRRSNSGPQRVAGGLQEVGISLVVPEVIDDAHQSPVEEFGCVAKRLNRFACKDLFAE
jgi:hypothetical protein